MSFSIVHSSIEGMNILFCKISWCIDTILLDVLPNGTNDIGFS